MVVRQLAGMLMVLVVITLATGCATTKEDNVSSIPWNRPQQWEGSGALGGFRPPGQSY